MTKQKKAASILKPLGKEGIYYSLTLALMIF